VPIPVIWTVFPTTVEIPEALRVIPPPVPPPMIEVSKSRSSPSVYPDPPARISTPVTAPPVTTTLAVAPSQVEVPSLKSLTF